VRKRKTNYPPAKTATRAAPAGTPAEVVQRPTVATINVQAVQGRSGLRVGGRVRVLGTGRLAGQIGTIDKLVTGGISQAIVRIEGGETGRVRTIDLEPLDGEAPGPGSLDQTRSPEA
jgi:hypothetical protein